MGDHTEAAPRRRRRGAEEVSRRIIDAAAEEFEALGYSGATTASIARRAEVTEAQVFRFFGSKQELFRAAIFEPLNRHFAEFHARINGEPAHSAPGRELARDYINELQDFMAQHSKMLMSLIVASAYQPGATARIADIQGLLDYFDRGATMMSERSGETARVDPRLMVRVSFAAVLGSVMFKDWLFPEGMGDDASIREALIEFVIDGIQANGPLG